MEFLFGLVVGAVAGGAVVFIWKKKIEANLEKAKQELEELLAKAKEKVDK